MSFISCFLAFLQVLEDVTGEEFVLFMKILSGLKSLQTVSGRQQLVELVAEQADLEQTFNPSDPDCVDRLLQCTRQAVPLFSVSIHAKECCVFHAKSKKPVTGMVGVNAGNPHFTTICTLALQSYSRSFYNAVTATASQWSPFGSLATGLQL